VTRVSYMHFGRFMTQIRDWKANIKHGLRPIPHPTEPILRMRLIIEF
jgi:hypothetical protein